MFRRMKMGGGYQILEETKQPMVKRRLVYWSSCGIHWPVTYLERNKMVRNWPQQQQSNAELSPINHGPRIQATSKTGFDSLKDYQLTVMLRNKMVNMKISWENFKSYVNRDSAWYELGEPKLQHYDNVLYTKAISSPTSVTVAEFSNCLWCCRKEKMAEIS